MDNSVATINISMDSVTDATTTTDEMISEAEGTWVESVPDTIMWEVSADGNHDDVVEVNAFEEENSRVYCDMDLAAPSTPVLISLTMDIETKVEPMESMDDGRDKLLPELPPASPPVVTSLSICDDDVFASLDTLANDLNQMISDFDQFLVDVKYRDHTHNFDATHDPINDNDGSDNLFIGVYEDKDVLFKIGIFYSTGVQTKMSWKKRMTPMTDLTPVMNI